MSLTECQCSEAGFCPFLRRECDPSEGRQMHPARHDECKNKPHYFAMFLGETRKPCHGTEPEKAPESDWNQSPCKHLGEEIETRLCNACGMKGQPYVVRECAINGVCSERKRDSQVECCLGCFEYEAAET